MGHFEIAFRSSYLLLPIVTLFLTLERQYDHEIKQKKLKYLKSKEIKISEVAHKYHSFFTGRENCIQVHVSICFWIRLYLMLAIHNLGIFSVPFTYLSVEFHMHEMKAETYLRTFLFLPLHICLCSVLYLSSPPRLFSLCKSIH